MSVATGSSINATRTAQVDFRRVLRFGLVGGAVLFLIVGIGMLETLDRRSLIEGVLSSGFAFTLWVPILFGYRIAAPGPVLEGVEPTRPGAGSIIAGALVGAVSGAVLGVILILASTVNLRGAFINLSPSLVNLLSFGGTAQTGAAVIIGAGALLGALGAVLHRLSPRVRKVLNTIVLTVISLSFLELVVGDLLRSAGLRNVDRWIYAPSRGVKPLPAALFSAVAVGLRLALEGRGSPIRARYEGLPESRRRRLLFAIALGALALGVFLPSLFGTFLNDVLSNVGLFILLGLGLNIVIGYAGLLDLGYVAFFAVGAYTTAIVTSPRSPMITPEMAFFEAIPWVLLTAAIAGLVIGTPVIRMRGDYLAIVTLGFGEIIRIALNSEWMTSVFGGAQGIVRISPIDPAGRVTGIRVDFGLVLAAVGALLLLVGALHWRHVRRPGHRPDPTIGGYSKGSTLAMLIAGTVAIAVGLTFPTFATWTIIGIDPPDVFRVVLVFVAIAIFVSWRLRDSRVGRAWMAVREDEQIAQSMGINIVTTKLLAFVVGAMMASLGGAFFAVKLGTIFPHSFAIVQSIIILVVVIVGGMGSIRGVIIGAVVLIGILGGPTQVGLLRELGEFKLLVYGVILVWMMLKRPEGLWPEARRAQELHVDELAQDAWLKAQPTAVEGADR